MFLTENRVKRIAADYFAAMLEDTDSGFDMALKLMTSLEPARLDRMVELAKEKRAIDAKIIKLKNSVEGEPEIKQDTEAGNFEEK